MKIIIEIETNRVSNYDIETLLCHIAHQYGSQFGRPIIDNETSNLNPNFDNLKAKISIKYD